MASSILSRDYLNSILTYNAKTGAFKWKNRSVDHFCGGKTLSASHICKIWNKRWAGKEAGTINVLGYRVIRVNSKDEYAHRLAWVMHYGKASDFIDHINHATSDNRIDNLRSVTRRENQLNHRLSRKNTSGICGVSWCAVMRMWRAQIKINRKCIVLGYAASVSGAGAIRRQAEIQYGFHPNHGKQLCA